MIALDLATEQQQAVDASFDACFAIAGAPGTGKTTALRERVERARRLHPDARPLVLASHEALSAYAVELLEGAGTSVRPIDDVEAALLFASACEPLFALEWAEFAQEQLDPEVPGLRSPERFLESAFRLIRRLRDADVEPAAFLAQALSGATEFYAKPPNFADPALLYATKDSYRDSLAASAQDLQIQYRREVDLAKILAKLYAGYAELVESTGRMTGRDAVIAARRHLEGHPDLRDRLAAEHRLAFVDQAETLSNGDLRLLQALFGERLDGVTLCGDPSSAIETLRMVSPERTFALPAARVELREQHRSPQAIELACRHLTRSRDGLSCAAAPPALQLHRADTPRDEAAFVAERVRAWLDEGTPPERIAVLLRSVRDAEAYETALLDRDVAVVCAGDANVFADRRALDALALLWNAYDPFRHDWLLRTLANPAVGLSDASLAILCAEPAGPQTPLFVLQDESAPTVRPSRWDPKRDLRLGWNVIRGEQDNALGEPARARIERFRALRERWVHAMHVEPFGRFARTVWSEGLAREGAPGSARARAQQIVLRRLLARLSGFLERNAESTVGDVLDYAERRMRSDLETCEDDAGDGLVRMLSVDAARGREFDRIAIVDVRAGAFPRWYAPDAFLFSPRLGMIAKENVGGATASRTAKFSYYAFRAKTRESYNARERRAFVYALRRARKSALVTASQRPTKGISAPEFLEELRGARLCGTVSS